MRKTTRALPLVLAAVLTSPSATGHSWYPPECCDDQDCESVPDSAVEEFASGWRIVSTGEYVPRDKARQSSDGSYHLCRTPTYKQIRCFFYPYRGT